MQALHCGFPQANVTAHRPEIDAAIKRVLDSANYCLGAEVSNFEDEFAKYNAAKYCVGVGSGTDALILSLRALDVGPGDEVITTAHTALATIAAIIMVGATPVLVDIEEDYYCIDPEKITITSKTKAIIAVHLYGGVCAMEAINQIATKHQIPVIEDCAQATGATYKNSKVGTLGDLGCFSFYPTKNLGAIGDGGAIISQDYTLINKLRSLRQYGWDKQHVSTMPSGVSRLDELQAAILRVKLRYLDQENTARRNIAKLYGELLPAYDIRIPKERVDTKHVYHIFAIQVRDRVTFKKKCEENQLFPKVHYLPIAPDHPGYNCLVQISEHGIDVCQQVVKHIISLPIYPELDFSTVNRRLQKILQQDLRL